MPLITDGAFQPDISNPSCAGMFPGVHETGYICTADIFFQPALLGPASGFFELTSNAVGSPHLVRLSGSSTAGATLELSSYGILFPDTYPGYQAATQSVTLFNSGTIELKIDQFDLPTGDMAFIQELSSCDLTNLPLEIAPNVDCYVTYLFSPSAYDRNDQELDIVSNSPTSPDVLFLHGNWPPLLIPSLIDFGIVRVGESATGRSHLINNQEEGSSIIAVDEPAGAVATAYPGYPKDCPRPPFELGAEEDCYFNYTYSPTEYGNSNQYLTIVDSNNNYEFLNIRARSYPSADPKIDISPIQLDFGDIVVGEVSETLYVTGTSSGSTELHVLSISQASAPFQDVSTSCPSTPFKAGPGLDCSLGYSFSPTSVGYFSTQVIVESSSNTSPDVVTLTGNAVYQAVDSRVLSKRITPSSKGMLSLVLYSDSELDVTQIIVDSVRFGSGMALARKSRIADQNKDGIYDLILSFKTSEVDLACSDASAVISGIFSSGAHFESYVFFEAIGCK